LSTPELPVTRTGSLTHFPQSGNTPDALHLFEVVLTCQRRRNGLLHEDVAAVLHNIGIVHLHAQNGQEALQAFEEASRIRKGALGDDHALVAVRTQSMILL
jgi:Tetratricopeptide repeat